jgi:hypothetical protein
MNESKKICLLLTDMLALLSVRFYRLQVIGNSVDGSKDVNFYELYQGLTLDVIGNSFSYQFYVTSSVTLN